MNTNSATLENSRPAQAKSFSPGGLPAQMLAVRKLKSEPGLWLQRDTPVPRIGPRDALIAVTYTGICGTDRHIYEWDAWSRGRVKLGITTGHEFVGRVVAVGSAITRTAV